MKQFLYNLLSLSLYSFQFRLLAYLFIVGSIPLICAAAIFYYQSVSFAEQELKGMVQNAHEHMLKQFQEQLDLADQAASLIAMDREVQRRIVSRPSGQTRDEQHEEQQEQRGAEAADLTDETEPQDASPGEDEQQPLQQPEEFGDYLSRLFQGQLRMNKYIRDICLSLDQTGEYYCSGPELTFPDSIPLSLNRFDKYYVPVERLDGDRYAIYYIGPLYQAGTGEMHGQIMIVLNMSKIASGLMGGLEVEKHIVYSRDSIIYNSTDRREFSMTYADLEYSEDCRLEQSLIACHSGIVVGGTPWWSVVEAPNAYMQSSLKALIRLILAVFALLFVLAVVSSLIFSQLITKPINNLRGLMKRAELGDLKAYWTSYSAQEINDLGESYNQMLNRLEELIKQVKYEEALKKEAEIEALQYQLNPHFLYNTLNTIKWVAKLHDTPQISEVVSALVRLLQASLGKKGEFITLREEVGLIQDYMDIQAFRYGEQIKIVYEIDPVAAVCLVPRMLLQPLVENALIHGIEPTNREGIIKIKAWLDRDLLMCQVEDNGKGMTEEQLLAHEGQKRAREKMSGIGLKHIREKIKLYYGKDYKMHIFSKPKQGTVIRLSLPIHRSED